LKDTVNERLIFGGITKEDCDYLDKIQANQYLKDLCESRVKVRYGYLNLSVCYQESVIQGDESSWKPNCLKTMGLRRIHENYDEDFDQLQDYQKLGEFESLYRHGWTIANVDINKCTEKGYSADYCLEPTAILGLDCDICNLIDNKKDIDSCKESIKTVSKNKVTCN